MSDIERWVIVPAHNRSDIDDQMIRVPTRVYPLPLPVDVIGDEMPGAFEVVRVDLHRGAVEALEEIAEAAEAQVEKLDPAINSAWVAGKARDALNRLGGR